MSTVVRGSNSNTDAKKRSRASVLSHKKKPTTKATRAIHKHTKSVATFEASRIVQIERSERNAWRVAIGSGLIAVLSWVALAMLMPLKTVEPYVIRVDESTGGVDIITTAKETFVSNSEIIDNYWVNLFVLAYETYDYNTIQKDYDHVGAFSSPLVGEEYSSKFVGPDALDKVYLDKVRVTIKINSIVPSARLIKTIRFTRITEQLNKDIKTEENLVATIGYHFSNEYKMTGAQRLQNPLGFYVRSYRVDKEL